MILENLRRFFICLLPLTSILSIIETLKKGIINIEIQKKIFIIIENTLNLNWLEDFRLQQYIFSILTIRRLCKLPELILMHSKKKILKFYKNKIYFNFLSTLFFTKQARPNVHYLLHLSLIGQSFQVSNTFRKQCYRSIFQKIKKKYIYFFEQSLNHPGFNQFMDRLIVDISFWSEGKKNVDFI